MSKSVQQEQAGRATSKQLDLSYVVERDTTHYVQIQLCYSCCISKLPLYTLLQSKDSTRLSLVGATKRCSAAGHLIGSLSPNQSPSFYAQTGTTCPPLASKNSCKNQKHSLVPQISVASNSLRNHGSHKSSSFA